MQDEKRNLQISVEPPQNRFVFTHLVPSTMTNQQIAQLVPSPLNSQSASHRGHNRTGLHLATSSSNQIGITSSSDKNKQRPYKISHGSASTLN